jgi:hypothetical protein
LPKHAIQPPSPFPRAFPLPKGTVFSTVTGDRGRGQPSADTALRDGSGSTLVACGGAVTIDIATHPR